MFMLQYLFQIRNYINYLDPIENFNNNINVKNISHVFLSNK